MATAKKTRPGTYKGGMIMRVLLIMLVFVMLIGCAAQETASDSKASIEASTEALSEEEDESGFDVPEIKDIEEVKEICNKNLTEEYDDFDEIYRYYPLTLLDDASSFEYRITPFLKIDNDCKNCQMYIMIKYTGEDWMFLKTMKIKTDNQTYSINLPRESTDIEGGKVYETIYFPIDVVSYYTLKDMITCDSCSIRLIGTDKYHDIDLDSEGIDQFKKVFNAYNKICGMPEV